MKVEREGKSRVVNEGKGKEGKKGREEGLISFGGEGWKGMMEGKGNRETGERI